MAEAPRASRWSSRNYLIATGSTSFAPAIAAYSGLMPASLTIGAHFSASKRSGAASFAGVDGLTGAPIAS
jgi:hypothetical protein